MKNKEEKLKYICDKIGYKTKFYNEQYKGFYKGVNGGCYEISENEIIFNQKFIDKFRNFLRKDNEYGYSDSRENILLSKLNNPVGYLYNLIQSV